MAETDFNVFGAGAGDIARGVTASITPPNGGSTFVFGFNSAVSGTKVVGLHPSNTNFSPLRDDSLNATGGSVRGALKRGLSINPTSSSIMLFMNLVAATENDFAYMLGLADNDPHEIVLVKASLASGLDPTATSVLRKSSATYLEDTWLHLRLDSIVNPNGDVVLQCFQSDLNTYPVTAPNWEAIPGMDDFIDDALGIATSETGLSTPLAGGFGGFAFQAEDVNRRAFVDHFELHRQR